MLQENYVSARTASARSELFFARKIREQINAELMNMGRVLGLSLADEPLHTIYMHAALRLFEIEKLFADGDIDPFAEIRTSYEDSLLPATKRKLRIGFYPVAANPFHWGHLLIGLSAIAKLGLDKVAYVIAGSDPRKTDLVADEIRHPMAQDVLRIFEPLFCYSSIARDTGCDGEENLFRILKLNPKQKIDAWYIAGADHYRRFYPGTMYPDTVEKVEEHIMLKSYNYDERMHSVSLAFIERGLHEGIVDTFLNVQFLQAMPFKASSTMIREALAEKGDPGDLALLPYTAYVDIRAFNLYAPQKKSSGLLCSSPAYMTEPEAFEACQ